VESTGDPTTFARNLFARHGVEISDLEVRRASLEDTYLTMVQQHESGRADQAATAFGTTEAKIDTEDAR
jgi:ABC-2 type transport system ATP-binding protein